MRATGIVRRIDELGRVVIPKEIRRTLRIREGDPLEIYTDRDGEVILKKYSPIGEMDAFAKDYTESLFRAMGHIACIVDRDQVVAASGVNKKELSDKPISHDLKPPSPTARPWPSTGPWGQDRGRHQRGGHHRLYRPGGFSNIADGKPSGPCC